MTSFGGFSIEQNIGLSRELYNMSSHRVPPHFEDLKNNNKLVHLKQFHHSARFFGGLTDYLQHTAPYFKALVSFCETKQTTCFLITGYLKTLK